MLRYGLPQGMPARFRPSLPVHAPLFFFAVHTPPPDVSNVWAVWIPCIVIEVVLSGSEYRDYTEKLEEYLAFGVKEYWIIDLEEQHTVVFRRSRDRWVKKELQPSATYRPRSLPGFEFACSPVFQAAR